MGMLFYGDWESDIYARRLPLQLMNIIGAGIRGNS